MQWIEKKMGKARTSAKPAWLSATLNLHVPSSDCCSQGQGQPDKASAHDNKSNFLSLMNSKSQQTVFSVAKFLVSAFNLRTSKMEVPSWLEDKLINQGVICM